MEQIHWEHLDYLIIDSRSQSKGFLQKTLLKQPQGKNKTKNSLLCCSESNFTDPPAGQICPVETSEEHTCGVSGQTPRVDLCEL